MCCAGRPVTLVGDLSADPSVVPSLAKGMSHGVWIDVEKAFAIGRGVARSTYFPIANWMRIRGHEGTSLLLAVLLWRPPLHVALCQIAGFPSILQSARSSLSLLGTPLLTWPESTRPSGQPVGLIVQIAPGVSPSASVQNIWDVHVQELSFVPSEVREQLLAACDTTDVDASWRFWSREAEASLARAYLTAGGPALSNPSSCVGRGQLSLRTKRLGGRCRDRIYRMDRADHFDVTNSGFFVNSLALCFASDVGLCRSVMYSKALSSMGLQTPGWLLHGTYGMLLLRWTPPALSPRLNLGPVGFLPTSMCFTSGPWTP